MIIIIYNIKILKKKIKFMIVLNICNSKSLNIENVDRGKLITT